MRGGAVEQVGTPAEIYRRPATPFVAEFVGTTNLLRGTLRGGAIEVGADRFPVPAGAAPEGSAAAFSLRPEALRPLRPGEAAPGGWPVLRGRPGLVEFLGPLTRAELLLPGGATLRIAVLGAALAPDGDGAVAVTYDPADLTVFAA
jgi:ABC-type Fe3+/spermidine/putrescine transport system ATPase subunit